jgi:hypothetical protein
VARYYRISVVKTRTIAYAIQDACVASNLPFAVPLMVLLSRRVVGRGWAFAEGEIHFPAVAQMVGSGPGRSKILYLSR